MPLGHRRTRKLNGETRIIAAWQQAASREDLNTGPVDKENQYYLPFGREYLAGDLNRLMAIHSEAGALTGRLDEDAFNRAVGAEDYTAPFGQRDLGVRASHGAHVLETAAGFDPALGETLMADETATDPARAGIIAVNMPDRSLVGHNAQFLEYFAVHGIMRIAMLADALWDKLHGAPSGKESTGFPIVINLSFGKQATSRDNLDLITEVLEVLNALRVTQGRRALVLVAPAGNENLERGNIRTTLRPGAEETFDLRILPDDQSANFVEFWTDARRLSPDAPSELEIQVIPPGAPPSPWTGGEDAHILDLRNSDISPPQGTADPGLVARLYSDRFFTTSQIKARLEECGPDFIGRPVPDMDISAIEAREGNMPDEVSSRHRRQRQHYLLAVKQTLLFEPVETAPAGLWRIKLRNRSSRPLRVDVNVQTDQTEQPFAVVNQRSYFERPEYQRYDETGRLIDSYSYNLENAGAVPVPTDVSNVLRRHGTINGLGDSPNSVLVAGHRPSDGRMLPDSSTGISRARPGPGRRLGGARPLASLPAQDGYGHFGRLSSGARDGSAAAMQGTSFAAAQMTRRIAGLLLAERDLNGVDLASGLAGLAAQEETAQDFPARVAPLKAGSGRMTGVAARKLPRF